MKKVAAQLVLLALAIAVALPMAAVSQEKKKRKKNRQPGQIAGVLKQLKDVQLTDEQEAKIKELRKSYGDKMTAAQKKLGDGRRKLAEARKKASGEGKKGKSLREAILASLTKEEQAAWKELQTANTGFRVAVAKVLTAEQREKTKLRIPKQKGKQKKRKKAAAEE